MGEHTPTPWSLHVHTGGLAGEAHINGPHNCAICYVGFGTETASHYVTGDEAEANAAFIVKAVNNHESLVAAAKSLIDEIAESGTHQRWKTLARVLSALERS
jgi:hypothetical protein